MTNAINYTESGGITIVCQEAEAEGERWTTISVSDTGPGISPDEQEHLFERFYRGAAAREHGIQGSGLGLALSDEIIRRHNGRLTVESRVGQGSTFTVWLPCTPPPRL